MKYLKKFNESDNPLGIVTIEDCPLCGKQHKFDMLNSKDKEYTRIFICPNTGKKFQADIKI